jgi:hypothetical protein
MPQTGKTRKRAAKGATGKLFFRNSYVIDSIV